MNLDPHFFRLDPMACFVALFVVFFSVLITVYSFGFMRGKKGQLRYYLYVFLTLAASLGVVCTNNLIVFIACWGFLAFLLFLLINLGEKERSFATARKTLIIVGGTDALMIFGLALVWKLSGSLEMDKISIALNSKPAIIAYLCLAAGAFAKAGAMPFHSWIPDTAEDAPTPVTALLPASLDKLLGIYFLARMSLSLFQMSPAMNTFLMAVGSFTIVAAVMMALVQHDMKRLLGYHAVSQVGYMVLGIGTANPVGIAGGLFHMLNHAIYKSCLFLSGGSVEKQRGTTDLARLGGLVRLMPVTFVTFLVASFAISGVPPFNGFASKWMVYQGIIATAKGGEHLWIVWLVAAMFGSALTLASFMKLIHSIFLGQPSVEGPEAVKNAKGEAGFTMWVPQVILAVLCLAFGIFVYQIPMKLFILPSLGKNIVFPGMWGAGAATLLICFGLAVGLLVYFLGTVKKVRESDSFVGGEFLENNPEMRVSGTEFYETIQDIGILKFIYRLAEKKLFDLYNVGSAIALVFHRAVRYLHNGVLPTYLAWCLLGMMVLFYLLLK